MFSQQTSRIYRVARGSGSQVIEVEQMLSQCKMFAGMVKQIGGPNGMMKNMEKAGKKGNANPAQMQAQMQKHFLTAAHCFHQKQKVLKDDLDYFYMGLQLYKSKSQLYKNRIKNNKSIFTCCAPYFVSRSTATKLSLL
jgi:hypothetical protein